MDKNEILELLKLSLKKVKSASDDAYSARNYSRSSATMNYCSNVVEDLNDVKKYLNEIVGALEVSPQERSEE